MILPTKRNNEYIWYCPRKRCGSIVHKTLKPFLMDGIFKCKHCSCIFTADELVAGNLCNLKRYIKETVKKSA